MSFSLGILSLCVVWQTSPLDELVRDPSLAGAVLGVCVLDSERNEVYAYNADLRLIPASLQKLATCAWAWETLGGEYRPKTRFWKTSGGVVVDAEGDPSLTALELDEVRQRLELAKAANVFVRQAFAPRVPPGWEHDDLGESYACRITALTVDGGRFELWTNDGRLTLLPRNYGVKIVREESRGPLAVRYEPWASRIVVRGALPRKRARLADLPIPNPDRAAASWLGQRWATADKVPTRAPDATVLGPPVRQLVQRCLTDSDNTVAEYLVLLAAGKDTPMSETSYDLAAALLTRFLEQQVRVSPSSWIVSDGSGLSRHNVATPRALCSLLLWAVEKPWGADFVASLPAPGTGTLRNRLPGRALRAKTGTLDLVDALAGITTRADGGQVVFAVMVNHSSLKSQQIRRLMDRFVERLEEYAPIGTRIACDVICESRLALAGPVLAPRGRVR